ncbi:hypothetical protein [Pararhizobium sp. PWRC1-1]|uniref:hypothetical protein n=1 Tax=Pararhizobium sp. PWRC1-1 TaxID=2804566 RepID=UPI003CF1738F
MTGKNADVAKVAAALERLDLDLRGMEATSSFADLARLLETALAQALDEPLMHEALETLDGHCSDKLLKMLRSRSRAVPASSLQH